MEGVFLLATGFFLVAVVLPLVLWARTTNLRRVVDELSERLDVLEARRDTVVAAPKPAPKPHPVHSTPAPQPVHSAPTPPTPPPAPAVPAISRRDFLEARAVLSRVLDPSPTAQPTAPEAAPKPAPVVPKQPAPARAPRPPMIQKPTAPAPTFAVDTTASDADSLETRIGGRWLLYIGVIAIVVGVSYFVKLAFDNRWITETGRVLIGGVAGALLVAAGTRFARKGYPLYGQMITGGGIAALYVSIYAAFNFYQLISQPVAFVLMFVVTTSAAWLADGDRSQGLALMAVGGGFATPFLLATGTDAEVALFVYDAILVAGTMYLARRREWPALNMVTYGFTVLTLASWANQFYDASKYLPTEFFLTLFCAMYLYLLREMHDSSHPLALAARALLWTAPAGYYAASLAVLADHSTALLIYLVALTVVGAFVGARAHVKVRGVFWMAAAVPLTYWTADHAGPTWLTPALAAVTVVYVIHLFAHLRATVRSGHACEGDDIALLHLNSLWAYGTAYLAIDAVNHGAAAPVAAAFALWHGGLAFALAKRQRDHALHFAALAFTLLTIAMGLQFGGAALTIAWAAEGAVVTALGLRERREWFRAGGLLLFGVGIARLIDLQFLTPSLGQSVLFNSRGGCGLAVIALTYGLAWVHQRLQEEPRRAIEVGIGLVTAKLLILALAVSEILIYWVTHGLAPFEPVAQLIDAGLLVGIAIVWLGLVRRQGWIRNTGGALLVGSLSMLLEIQFGQIVGGYTVLLNARAAAGLLAVAGFYGLAWMHHRLQEEPARSLEVGMALVAAKLLVLTLAASEILSYWTISGSAPFEPAAQLVDAGLLVGIAIVWLGLVRRQEWIRAIGGTLVAAAAVLLLSAQFETAPVGSPVFLNARVAAGLLVVAGLYVLAVLHKKLGAHVTELPLSRAVLLTGASLFTLSFLTSEIDAFWAVRGAEGGWSMSREALQTIVWTAMGSLLLRFGLASRRLWIRALAVGILIVGIRRLLFLQWAEAPSGYIVVANARLMASIIVVALLYGLAYIYRGLKEPLDAELQPRTVLLFAANVLSLTLLTSEITAFWHLRNAASDTSFVREMMLSITWAVYATGLIVVGIRKRYAPIRYFAIVVFAGTILKVVVVDMAELEQIYRVSSIVGLGVMLLVTSYLYNRFRAKLAGPLDAQR